MARVILVAGLPGSGKTHYLDKVSRETNAYKFDDFQANAIDNNPSFPYSSQFNSLIDSLKQGHDCIISDIAFCTEDYRKEAELYIRKYAPNTLIEWRYFANDPEQCRKNVRRGSEKEGRHSSNRLSMIDRFSSEYQIPSGVIIIPVWNGWPDRD